MTNDDERIVRMLRVSESDPVQQEAADAIERLTTKLSTEQEQHADCLEMNNLLQKDKVELTAALAAARELLGIAVNALNTTGLLYDDDRARIAAALKGKGDE